MSDGPARTFFADGIAVLAAPFGAEGQQAGQVRIGVRTPFSIEHSRRDGPTQASLAELRRLGRVEDQNYVFDWPDSGADQRFYAARR